MSVDIYETISAARKATQMTDGDQLAATVLAQLEVPEPWRGTFFPLVAAACAETIRSAVRGVERRQPMPTPVRKADPVALRDAFLASGFFLGDGRHVTWGEATVDDHFARIDMLSKTRDGLNRTIERHKWAIDVINVKKVKRLADIPADAMPLPKDAAA